MKIDDEVYRRIEFKFYDEVFTFGNECSIPIYISEHNISHFSIKERTPGLCSGLMSYGRCSLSDVPRFSRTREFYIMSFTNKGVFEFIRNNISLFDRQFFKDLIVSNNYSTKFERNCFSIMPLEYIDEEMCSLAILNSTGHIDSRWFDLVCKRKREVISEDIWKLAVRLYVNENGISDFLKIVPDKYKDEEFYREMCLCSFNSGMRLFGKGKMTDCVPEEFLTEEFLMSLLEECKENIAFFGESVLERVYRTVVNGKTVSMKFWEYAILKDGYSIRHINLNEERISYFFSIYDKSTPEYRYGLKDEYKRYLREKKKKEGINEDYNSLGLAMSTVALGTLMHGKSLDEVGKFNIGTDVLPIKFRGEIPEMYLKKYDDEEYLQMMCEKAGIEIVSEYDDLLYKVNFPQGWTVENYGYNYYVKDENGNVIIKYYYDDFQFWDRSLYVDSFNLSPLLDTDKSEAVKKKTLS